jgi:hypothetical protein
MQKTEGDTAPAMIDPTLVLVKGPISPTETQRVQQLVVLKHSGVWFIYSV